MKDFLAAHGTDALKRAGVEHGFPSEKIHE
jgi:hypothetical protein